ncbi:glycosyltransferase [Candidatus Beckwithbacteria bacterium]|nr:glycosyltransferase [Candidatus Beckwithbacteria bacterium]
MKLLIITPIFPPDIGGPATYVSNLLINLPKNVDAKVITFAKNAKQERNIFAISYKQSFLQRQQQLFKAIWQETNWADRIYIQGTLTIGLSAALVCLFKHKTYFVKYVGDEAWEAYQSNGGSLTLEEFLAAKPGLANRIKIYLQKQILHHAQKVIVPGSYLQLVLQKQYGLKNVISIPNAITYNPIKTSKKPNSIIFVGRLVPWKQVDIIIKSLVTLTKKTQKNWQLTIVGEGSERQKLETLVKKFNLEKQVLFTGNLDKQETFKKISQSQYLVLYSTYEGLSHTLLEAMAAKTKIIASDIKANSDVLENGKLGTLHSLTKADSLWQAFIKPYGSGKLEKAFEKINHEYSWQNHIKKIDSVLKLYD